jgi:D-alanyl-D-alanine carboxypeptidase (penicillin-binding protein 5/6)
MAAPAAPVQAPVATQTGAWILVDADTGAVLDAASARTPMRPASIFKILTALVAVQQLPADAQVPVSTRAASMPAMKIDMKAGQVWPLGDVLRCLLMVSANDAAAALAERVGGTLEGFADVLNRASVRLRLEDGPVLQDPAGLDDEFSVRGGNLISARDLAIITRAALAIPVIKSIVATPEYRFQGVDGLNHRLLNHNRLLRRYAGAIGVKTGYTRRAGNTLIAAATRNGRTMIAIVLKASAAYDTTTALLDRGFATPVSSEGGLERLPSASPVAAVTNTPAASSNIAAAPSKQVALPVKAASVAQGDQAQIEPPAGGGGGQRNFELPKLGALGAAFVLGVLPAAWIMFVARPRNRRQRQRQRQRLSERKRYQHRRLPLLSLFLPRLRRRRKGRRHATRSPAPPSTRPSRRPNDGANDGPNDGISPPTRPGDGPYPPISKASWPEDPLPPSRFDALVRERVAR